MSGTINIALTQQNDIDGLPLSGGRLFFFAAGTSTPQSAFQDIGLTIAFPNPMTLDASGRIPMFYLADGNIKIRLEDKNGLVQVAEDNLLVIGPSSGSGGGGTTVDPTTLSATGDIKPRFAPSGATLTGWVRCNGRTIGSATSGATELQSATTEALFKYLWTTPLAMFDSGGVAATKTTAAADWTANCQMAVPDMRGRCIFGEDDMGNTAAGRLTAAGFGADGKVLGNSGGAEQRTLAAANLPAHTHSGTTGNESASHTHGFSGTTGGESAQHTHPVNNQGSLGGYQSGGGLGAAVAGTGNTGVNSVDHTHTFSGTTATPSAQHTHSFTTDNGPGAGTALQIASPGMVMSYFIKL